MANLLRRFNKQVVGSDGRIYDYLAKITAYGDFKRLQDLNVIINSWNNILMTPKRTYLHDPEYGSNLHKMVFEPADESTVARIKSEIIDSITTYDDRATIEDIEVIVQASGKGYHMNLYVDYNGVKGSLSVSFDDSTLISQESGFTGDSTT